MLYWSLRLGLALALLSAAAAGQQPLSPVAPSPVAPSPSRGTQVVAPRLLAEAAPVYPDVPRADRARREVLVELTVDTRGNVHDVVVLGEHPEPFVVEATRVVSLLQFAPAEKDGQPVAARIRYLCVFVPPQQPDDAAQPAVQVGAPDVSAPTERAAPAAGGTVQSEHAQSAPLEVTVEGRLNRFDRLQQSADQVTVVRLEEAKTRSSDLGEVLARTPGVVVRRAGGFGSESRLSLGGLYDDAVQVFVDGVPIALSGLPTNVSLVSMNVVRHLEVYHGVVPLRLSADALGGAVNIATDSSYENRAGISYQVGSFGLHRATANAQARNEQTGFVSRLTGYFDYAKNDFEIDVEVPDERGRPSPARVRRFHDAYNAYGYSAELGYVERPWAERLVLKGFYGRFSKEYQHNVAMTVPYGEVSYGDRRAGVQLQYEQSLTDAVSLQGVAVVAHHGYDFADESEWVYDWFGNQVRERAVAGEIEAKPRNQVLWVNAAFGRGLLSWTPNPRHTLEVTTSPTYSTQTGDEQRQLDPEARDPLTAVANMLRLVSGIGHEWHALPYRDERDAKYGEDFALENVISVKHYYYSTDAEQPLPGNVYRRKDVERSTWGVNEGVRYGLTRWLFAKGSYEYATRLPSPQEVFGDGGFVQPNVELLPEVSHNSNIGILVDAKNTGAGNWLASLTGIRRDTREQIVLLGSDRFFAYHNVSNTVLYGAQGSVNWTSADRMFHLNLGAELLDPRNESSTGPFAPYRGDRIPNRPNLTASWAARIKSRGLRDRDELELFYQGRFTDGFFRGWESQGLLEYKQKVAPQTSHDLGAVHGWSMAGARLSTALEVQNVLDAKLFDNYGQQRPGRAFYAKVVADFF